MQPGGGLQGRVEGGRCPLFFWWWERRTRRGRGQLGGLIRLAGSAEHPPPLRGAMSSSLRFSDRAGDRVPGQASALSDGDLGLASCTVGVGHASSPSCASARESPTNSRMKISFRKLDRELPTPRHAHAGDGGVDLYARQAVRLEPEAWTLVPTGIAVAVPPGYAGLVVPRSGLAARLGVGVVNGPGLVDAGYRGEIKVILINHGPSPLELQRGERIAQLVVVPVADQEFVEVEELPESPRGEGGFGSTGR